MTSTHRLAANFSQSLGKEFPPITDLRTMVFFGTGFDGIETNRVVGGPPLIVQSGAPVHSANYVSLGGQPPGAATSWDTINTQNQRDQYFNSGWTWAVVARVTSTSTAMAMSDVTQTVGGTGTTGIAFNSVPRIFTYVNGARYTYIPALTTTTWHFMALTYTGGASGVFTLYDFTDRPSDGAPGTYATTGYVSQPYYQARFGSGQFDSAAYSGTCDVSWGMVSGTPMSGASLAALSAAVRPWLARRGIVM